MQVGTHVCGQNKHGRPCTKTDGLPCSRGVNLPIGSHDPGPKVQISSASSPSDLVALSSFSWSPTVLAVMWSSPSVRPGVPITQGYDERGGLVEKEKGVPCSP